MRGCLAAVVVVLMCGSVAAQTDIPAPSAPPHVVSLSHFIHATDTLETTLAFYHDVFGLNPPMPRVNSNPGVALLNNVPGIGLRASSPRFPDEMFGIEMTEFSNVDRKGAQALPTDPGAVELILPVRDIGEVYANVKKAGTPIVSRSGGPVTITTAKGTARALLVRDPDGYLVRAIEVPASEATVPGLVQPGVSMGVAVKDLDATAKFYHDVLGMDLTGNSTFTRDEAMADLVGAPANSQSRQMSTPFPGTQHARMEFYEWKGMTRTPFHLRVPDPGAGGWVARVSDLDAMFKKMKAQGVPMLTQEPVWFTKTISDIFVSDPNGMNLELFQTIPAPAQKSGN
jgi:methylmalonyl-CoA/ethylmalonyl-CoA epimerase